MMNIYVCTDHDGHYPVGVASVVVAASEREAVELLRAEIVSHGLDGNKPFTLQRIQAEKPQALVLRDGDY